MPDKKNIIAIDLLRFFAAFSVYYYHQNIGLLLSKYTHIDWLIYTDIIGAQYAVPLFFLISGFCIHLSSSKKTHSLKVKEYFFSRIWRLYPVYLIALIISTFIAEIASIEEVSLASFTYHFFVLQGFSVSYFNTINLVMWTITLELAFYFAYPLFFLFYRKFSIHKALLLSAIVTSISIIIYTTQTTLTLPQRYFFTNLWFAWCFGAWLCEIYLTKPNYFDSKNWKLISIGLFTLFISSFFVNWNNDILVKEVIYVCFWAPILIFLLSKEPYFVKIRFWLTIPIALGVSSYSLYLFHEPFIHLKNFLIHLYLDEKYQTISMILCIFIIPLMSYWCYLFIEKPLINAKRLIFTAFNEKS
jgi:peptidoglycan/LPS O-acetylase OafA/YrhL